MSRRDKMNEFAPGTILIHEMDDCFSFDSGDEYTRLIFMTLGSHRTKYRNFDSDRYEEVNEANAIDIFTGDCLSWGAHMFVSVDEFVDWVDSIKFLLEYNPDLVEKIKEDSECDNICDRFNKVKGMQVANAAIRHARMILTGIETGRLKFPVNIRKAYAVIARNDKQSMQIAYADELYELQDKLCSDSCEPDEISDIERRITELKDLISNINEVPTEEEINDKISEMLVPAMRRIASIEPFTCVRTLREEEIDRRKRYEKEEAKYDNSVGDNDNEHDCCDCCERDCEECNCDGTSEEVNCTIPNPAYENDKPTDIPPEGVVDTDEDVSMKCTIPNPNVAPDAYDEGTDTSSEDVNDSGEIESEESSEEDTDNDSNNGPMKDLSRPPHLGPVHFGPNVDY